MKMVNALLNGDASHVFILASQVGQEYEAWLKRVINMLCFSEQHEPSRDGVPD